MKFDINNKENLTNMYLIISTVIMLFLLYRELTRKEGFGQTEDINAAINTRYGTDIEAIRNLSDLATKLTTGGLTIPGSLKMDNIELGVSDTTKQADAGRIVYINGWNPEALCIVGKGKTGDIRKIHLWDDVIVDRNLNIGSHLAVNNGLTVNGTPMSPLSICAYMFVDNYALMYPIFFSMKSLLVHYLHDRDLAYIVLPGYKLNVYSAIDYGGTPQIIDNIDGTKYQISSTTPRSAKSIKIYYNTTEIKHPSLS